MADTEAPAAPAEEVPAETPADKAKGGPVSTQKKVIKIISCMH
jgi:hypothetical protein